MKSSLCRFILLCLPFTQAVPTFGAGQPGLSERVPQLDPRAANALPGQPNYTAIPNGQIWYDTSGNPIQAFGGGFLKVEDWYYWVGQVFSASTGPPYNEALVNMYKSQDLMNWAFVGSVINVYTPDVNGVQQLTYCQVQRPKLLYNAPTKKYVLWAHWEMTASFDPSQLFVATADSVEGPYTLTAKGHHRPGAGNQDPSAMGDRVGGVTTDYSSTPKSSSTTGYAYVPNTGSDYPPKVQQFNAPSASNPQAVSYISQSNGYGTAQVDNWWTYELTGIVFNLTLKAVSAQMTPYDTSFYNKYSTDYNINAASYIVRYPTTHLSEVSTTVITIGDPGTQRQALVAPDIGPGLDESSSSSAVLVHSGDAAFITCNTTNGVIYYTTDGTSPTVNSTQYWSGTRISITGSGLTVKAICALNGKASATVSQTYTVVDNTTAVPIFRPIVSVPSGTYAPNDPAFGYQSVKIYCPTYNTECYYTTDGIDPVPPVNGTNIGYRSRDMTVWQDPKDGSAYLFSASDNVYNRVWQLTDDFTDVVPDKEYDVFTAVSREAPTVVRNHGAAGQYVYLTTSTQSGWNPNQGQYIRTSDVTAGFSLPRDSITGYRNGNSTWTSMQPVGDASTYFSQPTFILNLGTDANPVYVYVGDRYNTIAFFQSTYVFMPLTIDDDAPAVTGATGTGLMHLQYTPSLQLSVANGSITPFPWKLLSLNKPVTASPSVQLTAAQIAAGTYNFSASAANDGINYDVDPYDTVQQYYQPTGVPFFWQVDLGQVYNLAWIGLSFQSVGGSDSVNRYTVSASADNSYWVQLVDNTQNLIPGFTAHVLSGSYRYVKINDYSIWDVDHNKEADWEAGVYEVSVYGSDSGSSSSSSTTTTTSSPTSSTTTSSPTTILAPVKCNHDNCLRQVLGTTTLAKPFCAAYTAAVNTATTGLPSFVSNCQANPSRISSACACLTAA
ncbi:coagulation factor 5 8 type domain-containing protein [Coniochaeta ligniaria NRRL 30616]|uniref:Coagulation factor 5 8 type domain-containing protein n=1 Tax=Coniochaeta ligniaria NRRL 30616 TaxID=1408157 RepID=A0A1J7IRX4_9PEZI|nr:coagulation factor 5 8 type domain-containing protein [Coniochaeta ligniaria NRRL 30616]